MEEAEDDDRQLLIEQRRASGRAELRALNRTNASSSSPDGPKTQSSRERHRKETFELLESKEPVKATSKRSSRQSRQTEALDGSTTYTDSKGHVHRTYSYRSRDEQKAGPPRTRAATKRLDEAIGGASARTDEGLTDSDRRGGKVYTDADSEGHWMRLARQRLRDEEREKKRRVDFD